MLNQLLKFTLVSSALIWLKPRWRGLLALCAFVLLVHVLHGEYLDYVALSENSSFLVWSYLCKWLSLVVGVLAYYFLALSGPRASAVGTRKGQSRAEKPGEVSHSVDDGFDFLRQKKQLQSRADKIIASTGRAGEGGQNLNARKP